MKYILILSIRVNICSMIMNTIYKDCIVRTMQSLVLHLFYSIILYGQYI